MCVCSVAQLCPTLCDPHGLAHQVPLSMGFFQARILEWVVISSFRGSSQTRDQTYIFLVFCIAGQFFTHVPSFIPRASLIAQLGKEFACTAGGPGSIPGSGRSPGEGIGYPLQYSWASLVTQTIKNLPAVQEIWV